MFRSAMSVDAINARGIINVWLPCLRTHKTMSTRENIIHKVFSVRYVTNFTNNSKHVEDYCLRIFVIFIKRVFIAAGDNIK